MDALKILVVDDESRMRKLVKDFLVKKGYEVAEARAFNSYIAEKVSIGRILPMFFCQFCVFYI